MPTKKKVKSEEVIEEPKSPKMYITSVHRNESDNDLYTAVFSDGSTEDKYIGDMTALDAAFADEKWQEVSLKVWKAV